MKTIKTAKRTVTVRSITRDIRIARSWVKHSVKAAFIVLGNAGEFWVVSGADAQRLEKVGYELAPLSLYA